MDPEEELLRRRAKAVLRKRARALRSTIPAAAIAERSARIVERLAGHALVAEARGVALFHPIEERNEVDLRALDARLRARGARVAYPAIDTATGLMSFRWVDDPSALEQRGYGFLEPPESAPEATGVEIIVVPALQIDPRGHRIGYGAGYYDRTLPRYAPPARTIGVAFSFQLVPELPDTPGDVPVQLLVTEERILESSST